MFKWLKFKQKVVRDTEAQKLVDLLFPPIELMKEEEGEFYIDRSVDSNLYAALVDLQDGSNDHVVHSTLKAVIAKLEQARNILYAQQEKLDTDARYLLVDIKEETDGT